LFREELAGRDRAPGRLRLGSRRLRLAALVIFAAVAGAGLVIGSLSGTGGRNTASAEKSTLRTFYIAADEVEWDYAPSGINQVTGEAFDEAANVFVENGPDRIGRVYRKALYREYRDASFTALKAVPERWEHLGALGPVIHAEVGDTIRITFKNNTSFPVSMHPHGVFYEKDSEGAPYSDGTADAAKADDAVPPGGTHVYTWLVPDRAGPGPMDSSSIIWAYHSHTDEVGDTNAGLVGPIIVTARGKARADGSPRDVDREFVTLFTVFDENSSPYLQSNIDQFAGDPGSVDPEDEGFIESNLMHSVNGYVYGNLPGLTMKRGERVRWYAVGMGTEVDLHTPHWHGQTLLWNGMRSDMVELLPMSMKTLDMMTDNPGTWLYHCHVNDHLTAGMIALFRVRP
jgi:FtsP/CotA-like multicopper oxidase with cupredoxin domain